MAIRSTERKIAQDMKKLEKQTKQVNELKHLRNKYWFEKFYWFLSSDGYLCIAGRDNNQIDTIYYRYFDNQNDILVSNDLDSSLKVVIKNPYKNKDITPSTLMQAGIFSLSATKAWENKMVTSPWFVKGTEVSKKDFDGSILPSGLLNVSKEKTYLPPCQLVMGIGLLWVGTEETSQKYKAAKKARDEELEFKLVTGDENAAMKAAELKAMIEKLGNLEKPEAGDKAVSETPAPKEESPIAPEELKEKPEETKPPGPNDQAKVTIRGKKNKLKKIKQKYGDQDEEERRLRMSVLGTLKQVEKKSVETTEKSSTQVSNDRKLRKKQQEANQLKKLLDELNETNNADDEDAEQSTVKEPTHLQVAGLIPSPNKTDQIVDCIPVFAPWNSLQKYSYKIKIQPGNLKKGKSVADVLAFFKKHSKNIEKEGTTWFDNNDDIIEKLNPQDALMSLTVSKLKVTYPGGESGNKGGNKGGSKAKGGKSNSKGGKGKKK
ncbi:unnamed protein product [Ambrosiozyma monospora]|uniref:Unnamed protein product n=1 Tax=Ambrosiozyma monospora TaxID=43982 RepID=A0ACB5TB38_AMBMO|nr:unnamed protein product [Ambrosiozyma monospora]